MFTLTIAFTATWDASFIGFTHNSFFSPIQTPLFLFPFLEVSSTKRKRKLIVLVLLSKKGAAEPFKEPVPEAEVDTFQGGSKKDHRKEQEGGAETLMMRVLAPPQDSELVERGVVGPEETHHEEGTVLRLYMNSGKRGKKRPLIHSKEGDTKLQS